MNSLTICATFSSEMGKMTEIIWATGVLSSMLTNHNIYDGSLVRANSNSLQSTQIFDVNGDVASNKVSNHHHWHCLAAAGDRLSMELTARHMNKAHSAPSN